MHIYIYIYIHISTSIYLYIYIYLSIYLSIYLYGTLLLYFRNRHQVFPSCLTQVPSLDCRRNIWKIGKKVYLIISRHKFYQKFCLWHTFSVSKS